MTVELTKWDSTNYLRTKEDVAAYLEAAFEDGDSMLITHALGVVVRAEGMIEVASRVACAFSSDHSASDSEYK